MLTPRGVAIASAMVITLVGTGLLSMVLTLYGVHAPAQAYAAWILGLFVLSVAVTYATIERFIYQKVRIILREPFVQLSEAVLSALALDQEPVEA